MSLPRPLLPILVAAAMLAPLAAPADVPLAVEIITAATRSEARDHTLTGEIVARDTLSAAFPAGGRIATVAVDAGDRVAAGFELARMESVQQEQAMRAAEAGLSTAEADRAQTAENLTRQEALLLRGATTRISRDTAEDALRIAEGVLAQAKADLDRARKALDDTVLTAPAAATIITRLIEPGQVVGAAQPAITMAIGPGLDAVFEVPEVLLTGTMSAPDVILQTLDRPAPEFAGTVREISPLVDATNGTVAVTVDIAAPPPGVTYGDAVRGTAIRKGAPRVALPASALSANAAGPAVWVVDPASMAVHLSPVVIERHETGRVILISGVAEGTLVVGDGSQLLYPGRIVRAAKAVE